MRLRPKSEPKPIRDHAPSPWLRKAVGLVLGTAAATMNAGCATQQFQSTLGTGTGTSLVQDPLAPGARLSPMAAARLSRSETIKQATAPVADPGQLGPFAVARSTWDIPCGDGKTTKADVYVPAGDGPFPVVLHAHGMWSSKDEQKGTALQYASHGFIVVAPNMPYGDFAAAMNAAGIEHMIDWVTSSPEAFGGKASLGGGIALSGHSFGGLAVSMAAELPSVRALVGLDPARQGETGLDVEPKVKARVLYVMGERELANQGGNGKDVYDAMTSADKSFVRVVGAHHTDFQNDKLTGPKNDANLRAMRTATAFLESTFGNHVDDAYAPGGAEVTAALGRGELSDR